MAIAKGSVSIRNVFESDNIRQGMGKVCDGSIPAIGRRNQTKIEIRGSNIGRSVIQNRVIEDSARSNISERWGGDIGYIVKTLAIYELDTGIQSVAQSVGRSQVVATIAVEDFTEYETGASGASEETELQRRSTFVAAKIAGRVSAMALVEADWRSKSNWRIATYWWEGEESYMADEFDLDFTPCASIYWLPF
jgi:hypothetical protein